VLKADNLESSMKMRISLEALPLDAAIAAAADTETAL